MKIFSKDMIHLIPGETYQLEDIARLSKFILIKMLELFGESAWGVIDIVGGIRKRLKDYNGFYLKYSRLDDAQKEILALLSQKPGRAVAAEDIADLWPGDANKRIPLEKEIKSLISTSWIIGGVRGNELVVLVIKEVADLINITPEYLGYLEAEKPFDGEAGETEFKFFDDLTQLTSYILKEPSKITNTGHLSKTALKKLMPGLSRLANDDWERLSGENSYPLCFSLLLDICELIGCIEVQPAQPNGQAQFLKLEEWLSYLRQPPVKRLRTAMAAYLMFLKESQAAEAYFFLEHLLCFGGEHKCQSRFLAPLKLLQVLNKDIRKNGGLYKIGEYYDEFLTSLVLEPLFYFGILERITITMPAPWRREETLERCLWRLSPFGTALGDILKNERKSLASKFDRRINMFSEDWLEKTMKKDELFSENFDEFFPPVSSGDLLIQNDMTFFAPCNASPVTIWLLHVFGEVSRQEYIINGRFTKESIIKALKSGLSIEMLTTLIKKESKTEPPATVLKMIEDWSQSYNRAIFGYIMVIVCDTPELAAELSANTRLSKAVLGRLGPQTVFIRRDAEKIVRQWLEKKSRVPLPGVYNAEHLAEWIDKHAGKTF